MGCGIFSFNVKESIMNMKSLLALSVFALSASHASTSLAIGPVVAAAVVKLAETAGDTAVAVTNSITGGVTSQTGKVQAKGRVDGKLTNTAEGKDAVAKVNIGGNIGTTAKKDVISDGHVKGDVINTATGANAVATANVGGNGSGR